MIIMKKCIFCDKEYDETDLDIEHCSDCGAPLRNKCSNYSCGAELDDNDCFCKYCGSPSLFNNSGIIKPEKVFRQSNSPFIAFSDDDDDLPFN